jgi:hypothetical protein
VIRVPVADEYSADLLSSCPLQEPRHRRIAKIDQQPETIVVHQEATARLARLRPRAAPAKNREPHARHPNDQSADNPRAEQATELPLVPYWARLAASQKPSSGAMSDA